MVQVVDALVVTLGLDPTKFKAGQAETEVALKRTGTEAAKTAPRKTFRSLASRPRSSSPT